MQNLLSHKHPLFLQHPLPTVLIHPKLMELLVRIPVLLVEFQGLILDILALIGMLNPKQDLLVFLTREQPVI